MPRCIRARGSPAVPSHAREETTGSTFTVAGAALRPGLWRTFLRTYIFPPMKRIAFLLPSSVLHALRAVRNFTLGAWYRGTARWCPVCQQSARRFLRFGPVVAREDARCPHCGALERHRLVWLYLVNRTELFDGKPKRMLHVAPEQCFERRLRARLGAGYLTADLLDPHTMERMDITDIQYPDESFDVIYCSHVLEHVPDDRRAMREFHAHHREQNDGGSDRDRPGRPPPAVWPGGPRSALRTRLCDRLREAGFEVAITQVSDLTQMPEYAGRP
jgi:hypothetical protein